MVPVRSFNLCCKITMLKKNSCLQFISCSNDRRSVQVPFECVHAKSDRERKIGVSYSDEPLHLSSEPSQTSRCQDRMMLHCLKQLLSCDIFLMSNPILCWKPKWLHRRCGPYHLMSTPHQ